MSTSQLSSFNYAIPPFDKRQVKRVSAAYTIQPSDNGFVLLIGTSQNASGTVNFPPASTVGAGFSFFVLNIGNNNTVDQALTLIPVSGNRIDNVTTLNIRTGEGYEVVCDGSNWWTINKRGLSLYSENAYNFASVGRPTVEGLNAIGLGFSYVNGTDAIAIQIGSNSSFLGARSSNALAIGYNTNAGGYQSTALGLSGIASGTYSTAIGQSAEATGQNSFAIQQALADKYGKYAYAPYNRAMQYSLTILYNDTTDATAKVLTISGAAAGASNQLILNNNQAYAFTGRVVARQKAANGTASAAWKIEGLIRREANAASTTLVASTVTEISNVPAWAIALSADTTNGGLKIEATGAAATNIRWCATIDASEVTFA